MEHEKFDPRSMDLEPSRAFDEASGLMAYGAGLRVPPAHLRSKVMAAIRPASELPLGASPGGALWRKAAAAAAILAAAVALSIYARPEGASLAAVEGGALIGGKPAGVGAALPMGAVIEVPPDGRAVVRIGRRAGFELSRGARAILERTAANAIELRLDSGWALSAVKTGTPYRISTPHGAARAVGTDFIVKASAERTYACICRGRLVLTGPFPDQTVAADHHADFIIEPGQAPKPAGRWSSLDGHRDEAIGALRGRLGLRP